ncbi:MAG TPA: UDP-N-acetylmuramoyl-tripeptide--D-alanyl-D-alanine ligase [Candidatus Limnocylindrales bacterium]|nr:UDP-N-acetylmuramoyl-tripeptide--D-alanyl-D-alanine ligase [Candidatus Limnocylindrales bacterium]
MTDVRPPSTGGGPPATALTADDLARLTGGRLLRRSDRQIRGGAVDSRDVAPGQLFVALPGEHTDGHRFLGEAVARGAAALLVTREPDGLDEQADVTVVRVPDGLAALWAVGAGWRARFTPLVVGVTGSIAKTSTKEAVAAVLARRFRTLRSEGNRNNEIGLPLTLLELDAAHEAAVLEMGMYTGGEIADLARIARPQIGVVTAVQPVHLSRIGSIEAIERAKAELVEALPADGTAVLNADDPRVRAMAGRTDARVVTYGFTPDADVTADDVASAGLAGMRFTLRTARGSTPVAIPTLGRLAVHNALAAAAVGLAAGMSVHDIAAGLADGWAAPHRSEVIRLSGVTIVDDSYNASPASVAAALELLSGLAGRRVAVLGEMLELGEGHEAGHRAVGAEAASVADLLVVVGRPAAGIAAAAREHGLDPGRVIEVADRDAARDALVPRLRDGDVVLVKASRGSALDLLVDALRTDLADR